MRALLAIFAVAAALAAPSAPPQTGVRPEYREELEVVPEAERDEEKARQFFDAGRAAAADQRWADAIPFFVEAYKYSGRPNQLFSLGLAHHWLYFNRGHAPAQLRLALLRFRQFLEDSVQEDKRAKAQGYIDELELYAEPLEGFDEEPVKITRLMLQTPVRGATVSVDQGEPRALPTTLDVEPGRHSLVVRARGYFDRERSVVVPEGTTVPLEVVLDARPALLTIRGPRGADVYVDGRRAGTVPQADAISLEAGTHQVAVARRGRDPFLRELELSRDEKRELEVELPMTKQRKLSYAAMGVGGASVVVGGVFTGLAVAAQTRARNIERERDETGVSEERNGESERAWDQRDTYRTAAITTGVVGGVIVGVGVVLYFTDNPKLGDRMYRPERSPKDERPPVIAAPILGPTQAGAALTGRF